MNKQAENINRLVDFALSSFDVKDPIEKTFVCPTCKKELPVDELESFECYSCSNLRADLYDDVRSEYIREKIVGEDYPNVDNREESEVE